MWPAMKVTKPSILLKHYLFRISSADSTATLVLLLQDSCDYLRFKSTYRPRMLSASTVSYVITTIFLVLVVQTTGARRRVESKLQAGELTPSRAGRRFSCREGSVCGDGFCCCQDAFADCNGGNLFYIPAFSKNITHLNFSSNVLRAIDEETLHNATFMVELNLSNNSLAYVHPNSFENLTRLETLFLDLNHLNDSEDLLFALKSATSLKNLTVDDNELHSLDFSHVTQLGRLTLLSVRNNDIFTVLTKDVQMQDNSLVHLDISENLLKEFPKFCSEQDMPVLPKLNHLNLEWNQITSLDNMRCLPNLTALILSGNAVYHTRRNFLQELPSLQKLHFKTCTSRFVDNYAFNHSGLQHLDVSENLWFFDHFYGKGIGLDLFHDMPSLQTVNISWTVFHFSEESEMARVLSPLSHVKAIILEGTGLRSIPQVILTSFRNLSYLDVGTNEIPYLPDNTFENITGLQELDMSHNYMTTFSETLLKPLLGGNKSIKFDFSANPFSCVCDLMWMIDTFQQQKIKETVITFTKILSNFTTTQFALYFHYTTVSQFLQFGSDMDCLDAKDKLEFLHRDSYICTNPASVIGVSLANVSLSDQACIFNYNIYIAVLFVSIFSIAFILVGSLVYRFRWQCRFLLYTIHHRLSDKRKKKDIDKTFIYDVFVSYDSRDNQWVHQVLQRELENNRRFRLCLHERDFIPGKFISHNIIERLEESRAILLVLSNSFLKSDWCRYEMFLSVKSGLAKKLLVVPVLLEDLDKTLLDSFVCTVLHTTTYIAWPARGTSTEIDCFWRNLSRVISGSERATL